MARVSTSAGKKRDLGVQPREGLAVSEMEYLRIALVERDEQWELWDGKLVRKPGMTFAHNELAYELGFSLRAQLDHRQFSVRVNAGHAQRTDQNYFIPDVIVIPRAYTLPLRGRRDRLETYAAPLPLVVEVWSPSTGNYDLRAKLEQYRQRGDLEIWYIHPYDHSLTAWRLQPDGGYGQSVHRGGTLEPASLAGVTIDLDALFES